MQEYYKVLGLSENATNEEIEAQYNALKKKYSEDRFLEGEEGNLAAKKLTELENAYAIIKDSRKTTNNDNTKQDFSVIEGYIKSGEYTKAQYELDNCTERTAEWHYLQSVLFYKKGWLAESKKQLEIAKEMDPANDKYRQAYEKLTQKIETNQSKYQSGNFENPRATVDQSSGRPMMGDGMCESFCECCAFNLCLNMLCSGCCR